MTDRDPAAEAHRAMAIMVDCENVLIRRDALAALTAEVARLRARRAVACERCVGSGFALILKGAGVMDREKCRTCAGSGAVMTEGDRV